MRPKIYTRTGDSGDTSLYGGMRVKKNDQRVNAYGSLDELNSLLGLVINRLSNQPETITSLKEVQFQLLNIGSFLAGADGMLVADLSSETSMLEKQIDKLTDKLPALANFIIPGGNEGASWLYYARSVVRRAEREVVAAFVNQTQALVVLKYLNRLSDYLFTLARWVNHQSGVVEPIWQNKTIK